MFLVTVLTCVLLNSYNFQQNSNWNYNLLLLFSRSNVRVVCVVGFFFNGKGFIVTNSLGFSVTLYVYFFFFLTAPDWTEEITCFIFFPEILISIEPMLSTWAH